MCYSCVLRRSCSNDTAKGSAMPHFPMIDRPCPLDAGVRGRLDGHCTHCDKAVHRLDRMNEDDRRRLLAGADGPICVAYAAPANAARRGRFGAAIAATLICSSGLGTALPAQAAGQEVAAPATGQAPGSADTEEQVSLEYVVLVGGIDNPRQALRAIDTRLPELPMRRAEDLVPADTARMQAAPSTPDTHDGHGSGG